MIRRIAREVFLKVGGGVPQNSLLADVLSPSMAIPKKQIFDIVGQALTRGKMNPMTALALMSANMLNHSDSGEVRKNQKEYLKRALRLFTARCIAEVAEAEDVPFNSEEYKEFEALYQRASGVLKGENNRPTGYEPLEHLKKECYIRDITENSSSGPIPFMPAYDTITRQELDDLLSRHNALPSSFFAYEYKTAAGETKKSTSALPKGDFTPLLQTIRDKKLFTEAQTGLFLSLVLHSTEIRKKSKRPYIEHPMAVAELVTEHAENMSFSQEEQWKATIAALLHDIGEHTDFDVESDLDGLLSPDIIEAVKLLHKKPNQTYLEYIDALSNNRIATLVKLADIVHNSSDAGHNPEPRQKYVYPLAALYLREKLDNPQRMEGINFETFCVIEKAKQPYNGLCSQEDFDTIRKVATKELKREDFDTGRAQLDYTLPKIDESVLSGEWNLDAYTRREEKTSLQRPADVQLGC